MTERENLPAAINLKAKIAVQPGSLVARGLMAVQRSKELTLTKDNDALYREARTRFNKGTAIRNWDEIKHPDLSAAFKKFQQLADNKYGKAYYPLSILYLGSNGEENHQDCAKHFAQLAIDWCLAHQARKDAELWCDLGDMYREGHGVAEDSAEAVIWYRKAAELGDMRGQWEFGVSLLAPDRDKVTERQEAFSWLSKAAEQGDAFLQDWLGDLYWVDSQYEQALFWYHRAAEQGNDSAQYDLGKMYEDGMGVAQSYVQAAFWYRKAADQGYSLAQWKLGEMHSTGRGVEQNDEQAIYWFHKAAEQCEDCQYELGKMYSAGEDVEQSHIQAELWYRKADEEDNADTQMHPRVDV
ncbi:MAG: sel1 repeat family protein [Nitrosospira sp.]|nr:sel1 repeat family protein [Nitrosospira sp.]